MNRKGPEEQVPQSNQRDRRNAQEWLEEMGFVIDHEEQPQTSAEPEQKKPAA